MFNKKILFVISVFLLFILQISFVCAQNDNQTEINEEYIEYYDINNNLSQDFQNTLGNNTDEMEFYQGDIPIHIDSPCEGTLTVLIDGNNYVGWEFIKNEVIHIPTYNYQSFYNDSKLNIDVGLHNISFIFNFRSYISNDADIFLDENSTLNFKFNDHITNTNKYTYNSTLNLLKKDKTIHILNFTYYNLRKPAQCVIYIENLENYYYDGYVNHGHLIGVIIKNNKYIYKQAFYELDNPIIIDSIYEEGIYNFTVINSIDGTMDSLLFKAEKYRPKLNVSYIIDGNSIEINLMNQTEYYNDWVDIIVDNIYKELPMYLYDKNNWTVFFDNLTSGVHTLKIEGSGDYMTEDFYYVTSFVIEDGFDFYNKNKTDISQNNSDDINSSLINGNSSDNPSGLIKGDNTSGNSLHSGEIIKNDRAENSHSNKNILNSKETIINPQIGDDKSVQSNSFFPAKKSHEIIKKSASKINNDLIPFYLIIIVIILLIIGYFKFGEKI